MTKRILFTLAILALMVGLASCEKKAEEAKSDEKTEESAKGGEGEAGAEGETAGEAKGEGDEAKADDAKADGAKAGDEKAAAAGDDKPADAAVPAEPVKEAPVDGAGAAADAAPEAAAAVAGDGTLADPGKVTIDQVMTGLRPKAGLRVSVRAKQFVDAGVVTELMALMPPDDKAEYDSFVEKTKFDPTTAITGMMVVADGEVGPTIMETGNPLIVLGIDGGLPDEVVTYLEERDDDNDDKESDGPERMHFAFLVDLQPAQITRITERLAKPKEGSIKATHAVAGGSLVTYQTEDRLKYAYLWSGGLIFGGVKTKEDAKATAEKEIAAVAAELKAASEATGTAPTNALNASFAMGGKNGSLVLDLVPKLTLTVEAPIPPEQLPQIQPLADNYDKIKAAPDAMLTQVPPPLHPLMKLLISNSSFVLEDGIAKVALNTTVEELKAVIPK